MVFGSAETPARRPVPLFFSQALPARGKDPRAGTPVPPGFLLGAVLRAAGRGDRQTELPMDLGSALRLSGVTGKKVATWGLAPHGSPRRCAPRDDDVLSPARVAVVGGVILQSGNCLACRKSPRGLGKTPPRPACGERAGVRGTTVAGSQRAPRGSPRRCAPRDDENEKMPPRPACGRERAPRGSPQPFRDLHLSSKRHKTATAGRDIRSAWQKATPSTTACSLIR